MIKRFFWKVWLRVNPLASSDDKSYVAEVSTEGRTLHNSDIARMIVDAGSEIKYETLLAVINETDLLRSEKLCEGYCIQTLICRLAPQVLGAWPHATTTYDPEAHKVTLGVRLTAQMRDRLRNVRVEVLGLRPGDAFIGRVTDVSTGLIDGTISPEGSLIIEGRRIKVTPSGEAGLGVFLTDGLTVYPLPASAINYPKKIVTVLPSLPPGSYSLYILTRFVDALTLLNEPRRIDYNGTLTVR
ncbi:MAG: DUF4469 domain-containing protein [Tannerellaceae bacterium]|jgi:hypothetical protein|nr:DUF4469 domain-containing protein [Tannerellaceae bacterium]